MLSDRTLDYGSRAARALLGLDSLYRAESGDRDGLVVVNLDREGRFLPETFAGYDEVRKRFEELREDAAHLPEPDRRTYYGALCHSSLAFVAWRQQRLGFTSQIGDFLHVPGEPASEAEIAGLRRELQSLLDGMGYRGTLEDQCAAWEEQARIPKEAVPGIAEELMAQAWERTEKLLMKIPAPRSDGMRLVPVSGVAYNARCDYLHRTVELNVDPVLTRPGLKHLVAHECYPGHYLQFKLRETWERQGRAAADGLLSVVNTASSSVFEGIGDAGILMLDWFEDENDYVQSKMTRYRAGIATQAAWQLHALGWSEDRVADALRQRTLVGGEGWVQNRIRFIAAPARAVLIWSYWWGERVVEPAFLSAGAERRAEFLEFLYGRMHSNATLSLFPA
jgi:hypothetical protein